MQHAFSNDWGDVLTQVETALARAEQDAAAREHALAAEARPQDAADAEAVLRRVAERLAALEAGVARAGRVCGQVETLLSAEEEAVREWACRAGAVAEKLAAWAGGTV